MTTKIIRILKMDVLTPVSQFKKAINAALQESVS